MFLRVKKLCTDVVNPPIGIGRPVHDFYFGDGQRLFKRKLEMVPRSLFQTNFPGILRNKDGRKTKKRQKQSEPSYTRSKREVMSLLDMFLV